MAMRDHGDTMEPYEPSDDAAYDWDYDGEPGQHNAPTILWGRVAVLAAAILLAFLVGRMTAGGGVPEEDLDRVRAERDDAQAQVTELEGQVTDLQTQLETAQGEETPPPDDQQTPAADGEEDPNADFTTYTVQANDTLQAIAEEVYCDPRAFDGIADANPTDVGPPPNYIVSVGAELIIPDDPDANAC